MVVDVMPLLRGITEKHRRFDRTTNQFGADDCCTGDSLLMPDSALYYPLLPDSLHSLTLSDPPPTDEVAVAETRKWTA